MTLSMTSIAHLERKVPSLNASRVIVENLYEKKCYIWEKKP